MKNIIKLLSLTFISHFCFLQFSNAMDKNTDCHHNSIVLNIPSSYDTLDIINYKKLQVKNHYFQIHRRCYSCELETKNLYFCEFCGKIIFCDIGFNPKFNSNNNPKFKPIIMMDKIKKLK